jgi:hypothetical protein
VKLHQGCPIPGAEEYGGIPEFQNRKQYLLSKNKFEQTETHSSLSNTKITNSDKIKWFLSLEKDSSKFNELRSGSSNFSMTSIPRSRPSEVAYHVFLGRCLTQQELLVYQR